MRDDRRWVMLVLLLTVMAACTGCMGRLIREGAGAVTGASGKAIEIQPLSGNRLDTYGTVTFDTLSADVPGVPAGLPDRIRRETLERLRQRNLFSDAGSALVIRGRIIHYETGGTVDAAIGPLQEVIARIELADPSGGAIAAANIVGRAKSLTAGGSDNLADGAAKGIVEWIAKHRAAPR